MDTAQVTVIPSDWDLSDPNTWTYSTTVDACTGIHSSGAIYRDYQTITHDVMDHQTGEFDDESLWADEETMRGHAEWWADHLGPVHEAECAIAEALPDEIEAAMRTLGLDPANPATSIRVGYDGDWDTDAAYAQRIIDALAQE